VLLAGVDFEELSGLETLTGGLVDVVAPLLFAGVFGSNSSFSHCS
jgi:hypothetical protein